MAENPHLPPDDQRSCEHPLSHDRSCENPFSHRNSGNPFPRASDDHPASDDPFDPMQHVMHGLLSVYFDATTTDTGSTEPPGNLIASTTPKLSKQHASLKTVQNRSALPRGLRWAGLALAACVVLALLPFTRRGQTARADIFGDAVNAGSAWFRLVGSFEFVLDPDSPDGRAQQQTLDDLAQKVRAGLERMPRTARDDPSLTPFCIDWQSYYCLLRNLGRRDEAVREATAAIEFAKARVPAFVSVFLDGLGNIHAAYGEYPEARQRYLESIELRRAKVLADWKKDPHYGEPNYEGHLGWGIAPMYLRLMHVSLAEGKLAEARDWHSAAQRALAQCIRTTLEMLVRPTPAADATLLQLFEALPDEYQRPKQDGQYTPEELRRWAGPYWPTPSLPAWVRTVLYDEAVLLHAEGDHAAAQAALDRAATIQDYPDSSEFRLPFLEKLESARLAVIRKDYAAALAAVQAAREFVLDPAVQPTDRSPQVNRLPTTPARAAELDLLEGVALLGQDPSNQTGRARVSRAMELPERLAAALPPERWAEFWRRFESWRLLAEGPAR